MMIRTTAPAAPCGMNGVGCSGNCGNCPGRGVSGVRGLGAFYDDFPAPFNNPLILAAIAVAALMIFGGGLKFLGGGRKSGKRNKLRLIRAQAEEQRAKLLAA